MNPGIYRHRIIVQEAIETGNEFGEMITTWTTFRSVRAAIQPLRGQELWAAAAIQARTTTRIRIRYLEGVTPKMRVLFGSRIYLIDAVIDPEERHVEMQLLCQEWVGT